MKSAIGNAFIVNFIVIFTVVFVALFVGSTSYTKALRIKNRITDIIEENDGYTETAKEEIEAYLADAGYRISTVKANCEFRGNVVSTDSSVNPHLVYPKSTHSNYDYCIFQFSNDKGDYYGVKTYMYLDLPLIGDRIKIGVYGETKTLGMSI